eukprot:PITA_15124
MFTEGFVLGHHILGDAIKVDKSKVEVIFKLSIPNCQNDVRSFLGFTGYYRRFIENFTKIASPLFKLLTKDCEFNWNFDCQLAFETLKTKIFEAPILRGPNWKLPFHISTDASDTALGVVLGQKDLIAYAIYYTSNNLTPTELNYTVTKKEFLAVVHAINKFRNYIIGYETFVHIDHSVIRYLMNKPITNGRITRWLLLLQEFNITVLDRLGKQNTVADFLSKIQNIKEDSPVEDKFPDEYLFAVTTQTPWFAEVKSLPFANEKTVVNFLFEDIFTRFGVPREIVKDQGSKFTSNAVEGLVEEHKIKHRKSTPYHPQANDQVESTNKVIEKILTNTVHLHRRDWAERLPGALWAYRTTWRNTTGHTTYELVYGKQILFPIEFQIITFKMEIQLGLDLLQAQKHRLEQLNELDEIRQEAVQRTSIFQQQRAKWHDKYIKDKRFQVGYCALLFDSKFKYFQRKFQTHWLGPYEIEKVFSNGAVRIRIIDESKTPLLVNGHRLKIYQKPISKETFIKIFQDNSELKLVKKNSSSPLT